MKDGMWFENVAGKWRRGVVLPIKNYILHVLSHGIAETQVVIPGKQAIEESQKTCTFNRLDMHRGQCVEAAGNSSSMVGNIGDRPVPKRVVNRFLGWG